MILNKDDDYLKIEPGYNQIFKNEFTIMIGQRQIIKMKNSGTITERDLKISKFLFNFIFATDEQIKKYLNILYGNDYNIAAITKRLNKLVEYRILNKFILSKTEGAKETPETLSIYCLDLGGRYLLANYSTEDTADWYSTVNMKASELISKDLATVNFYLSVIKSSKEKLVYFNAHPDVRVGKTNIMPSFEMCIENNGNKNFFVGEVVREWDFPTLFRNRVHKLEELFQTNGWKKYYYDSISPPVLFLLTDSDGLALDVSKLITGTSEFDRFRTTTDKRIERSLSEVGAFLRYDSKEDVLEEIQASVF